MRYCPSCYKTRGVKEKNFLEYAKRERGVWIYFKRCLVCNTEFDVELDKDTQDANPFKEDKE